MCSCFPGFENSRASWDRSAPCTTGLDVLHQITQNCIPTQITNESPSSCMRYLQTCKRLSLKKSKPHGHPWSSWTTLTHVKDHNVLRGPVRAFSGILIMKVHKTGKSHSREVCTCTSTCYVYIWGFLKMLFTQLCELPGCLPTCKFGHSSILWNTQLRNISRLCWSSRTMDQGLSQTFVLEHG